MDKLCETRRMLSFELTSDWWAWYVGRDGDFLCSKVVAIGLSRVWIYRGLEREYSHDELVGLEIDDDGEQFVSNDLDNFIGLHRTGVVPEIARQ